jgi:hypothetical protein
VFATGLATEGDAVLGLGCGATVVAFFGVDTAFEAGTVAELFVFVTAVVPGAVALVRAGGVIAVGVFVPAAGSFAGVELKALG